MPPIVYTSVPVPPPPVVRCVSRLGCGHSHAVHRAGSGRAHSARPWPFSMCSRHSTRLVWGGDDTFPGCGHGGSAVQVTRTHAMLARAVVCAPTASRLPRFVGHNNPTLAMGGWTQQLVLTTMCTGHTEARWHGGAFMCHRNRPSITLLQHGGQHTHTRGQAAHGHPSSHLATWKCCRKKKG